LTDADGVTLICWARVLERITDITHGKFEGMQGMRSCNGMKSHSGGDKSVINLSSYCNVSRQMLTSSRLSSVAIGVTMCDKNLQKGVMNAALSGRSKIK
jgi:hypothetical protein